MSILSFLNNNSVNYHRDLIELLKKLKILYFKKIRCLILLVAYCDLFIYFFSL